MSRFLPKREIATADHVPSLLNAASLNSSQPKRETTTTRTPEMNINSCGAAVSEQIIIWGFEKRVLSIFEF